MINYHKKHLGKKLTKCRLMHGYTQKEFANVLSVQESTLIDWEKDKNKPNVSNLKKLETFLEILIKKLSLYNNVETISQNKNRMDSTPFCF